MICCDAEEQKVGASLTDSLALTKKFPRLGLLRKQATANSSAFSAPYGIESCSKRKTG
jgi:hypothetical protein